MSRELQLVVPTQHHPLDKKSSLFTSYKSLDHPKITSRNYQQFLTISPIPTSGSLGEGSILLALWFWYRYMIQMLYLMATPSSGNALIRVSKCWKLRGTQENSSKGAYPQVRREGTAAAHAGHLFKRCVPPVHLLQGREACSRWVSYVWPVEFSPPFLILWFWPVVLFNIIIIIELHVLGPLYWLSMVLIHDFRKSLPI